MDFLFTEHTGLTFSNNFLYVLWKIEFKVTDNTGLTLFNVKGSPKFTFNSKFCKVDFVLVKLLLKIDLLVTLKTLQTLCIIRCSEKHS